MRNRDTENKMRGRKVGESESNFCEIATANNAMQHTAKNENCNHFKHHKKLKTL